MQIDWPLSHLHPLEKVIVIPIVNPIDSHSGRFEKTISGQGVFEDVDFACPLENTWELGGQGVQVFGVHGRILQIHTGGADGQMNGVGQGVVVSVIVVVIVGVDSVVGRIGNHTVIQSGTMQIITAIWI